MFENAQKFHQKAAFPNRPEIASEKTNVEQSHSLEKKFKWKTPEKCTIKSVDNNGP